MAAEILEGGPKMFETDVLYNVFVFKQMLEMFKTKAPACPIENYKISL